MSEAETLKMVMVNDTEPLCPRGTEEVFQALEDNQVALSTMKASRFVKAFEKDVDHWERCLSLILEVIEMVLTVQRQWMYLEVRSGLTRALPTPAPALSYVTVIRHARRRHQISSQMVVGYRVVAGN